MSTLVLPIVLLDSKGRDQSHHANESFGEVCIFVSVEVLSIPRLELLCDFPCERSHINHEKHPLPGQGALIQIIPCGAGKGKERTVKKDITTKEARAWAEGLRLELLQQKRAAGDPRAPMRAKPGREAAFEKAEAGLAAADFILKTLEAEERQERARAVAGLKRKAVKTADALLDGAIVFGLASAAMLGVAAAAVALRLPDPVVQATAIIGVGVALARAVARK